MNRETLGYILDPFFTTEPKDPGTGFACPVTLGIAQRRHGTIHPHSEPEVDTTFKVYLPILERTATRLEPVSAPRVKAGYLAESAPAGTGTFD